MKIAFDEHIPAGVVKVFETLVQERKMRNLIGAKGRGKDAGYSVVASRDYNPSPDDEDYLKGRDDPWITRFAADGGKVIISGNVKIMSVPQEILAIQKAGLVTFFFESKWNNGDFFKKSAVLLWYWASVVERFKSSKPGDVYRIPAIQADNRSISLVLRSGQLEMTIETSEKTKKAEKKIRKKTSLIRASKPAAPDGQGKLDLPTDK